MFNITELIQTVGYLGIFAIIFAETGLMIGIFLPGDSLLFTVGILAGTGRLNIYFSIFIMLAGAMIGDLAGYAIGKKFGPKLFTKEDSLVFKKSNIEKAQKFFEKYGAKTIIIARFVPVVRSFAPTIAGAASMNYYKFLTFNVIGAALWVFSITLLGYFLGQKVDNAEMYILPGVALIVLISVSPYIRQFIKDPEARKNLYSFLRAVKAKFIKNKI
jgi:membrane-associated protein